MAALLSSAGVNFDAVGGVCTEVMIEARFATHPEEEGTHRLKVGPFFLFHTPFTFHRLSNFS